MYWLLMGFVVDDLSSEPMEVSHKLCQGIVQERRKFGLSPSGSILGRVLKPQPLGAGIYFGLKVLSIWVLWSLSI